MLLAVVEARADDIPGDCLTSFNVKDAKLSASINWTLGANGTAPTTCAAGELLREQLFVDGSAMLKASDPTGGPIEAQNNALAAFDKVTSAVQALPGDNNVGVTVAALVQTFSKYKFAACLLTVEAEGGACWGQAVAYLNSLGGFFLAIYKGQQSALKKQNVLNALQQLRPAIAAPISAHADAAGARARWVAAQVNLCRAIQSSCL